MKKLVKIISVLIFLECCILATLLIVPIVSGKKVLIGHISGTQLTYGVITAIFILGIVLVIVRYGGSRCRKNLIIMIAVSVISTGALLGTCFLYLLFVAGSETYYTFYSPDGRYSVVAEERSWLLAGSVILYERTNPFLVEERARLLTDDGFRAISSEAYEIWWNDNVVTFTIETTNWDQPKDTAVVILSSIQSDIPFP